MAPKFELTAREREFYLSSAKLALPRHTSYPTANLWIQRSPPQLLEEFIQEEALLGNGTSAKPLGLYLHIPFCNQLCYYCGCHKFIVEQSDRRRDEFAARLVAGLIKEVAMRGQQTKRATVDSLHLGGGTPTWLSPTELRRVLETLQRSFTLTADLEFSVEIDPRVTTEEHLAVLREFGCSRISLGVQDFAPRTQEAVNRIQPFDLVATTVNICRKAGIEFLNFDLIYGLPYQTIESMRETIEQTINLRPSRIAFYRMAMIPEIFRWQRLFGPESLPSSNSCLDMNLLALNEFSQAGYRFIGLDHFALPTDPLYKSYEGGSLNRNFQGMSTGRGTTILGIGPSAISQWHSGFTQNQSDFFRWEKTIGSPEGIEKHWRFQKDDRVRRDLLLDLYCSKEISFERLAEREHATIQNLESMFAKENEVLASDRFAPLVKRADKGWTLTSPLGELLIRIVASVFDGYLPPGTLERGLGGSASLVG